MSTERRSIARALARFVKLRCPVCGLSSIVRSPFHIKHHCAECGALYKREDGFFVGAIAINLVTTESVILLVYFALMLSGGAAFDSIIAVLFTTALLFPVAFYHHSWGAWLGLDHFVETLPRVRGTTPPPGGTVGGKR